MQGLHETAGALTTITFCNACDYVSYKAINFGAMS